jgi:hypothetical protein
MGTTKLFALDCMCACMYLRMYVHASHTHTLAHTHKTHTQRDATHRPISKNTGCVKQLKKQQDSHSIHGGSLYKCPMCNRDAIESWVSVTVSPHTRVTDGSLALNAAAQLPPVAHTQIRAHTHM